MRVFEIHDATELSYFTSSTLHTIRQCMFGPSFYHWISSRAGYRIVSCRLILFTNILRVAVSCSYFCHTTSDLHWQIYIIMLTVPEPECNHRPFSSNFGSHNIAKTQSIKIKQNSPISFLVNKSKVHNLKIVTNIKMKWHFKLARNRKVLWRTKKNTNKKNYPSFRGEC